MSTIVAYSEPRRILRVGKELPRWINRRSLEWLLILARRVASAPIFLVLTYRGDELHPGLAHRITRRRYNRHKGRVIARPNGRRCSISGFMGRARLFHCGRACAWPTPMRWRIQAGLGRLYQAQGQRKRADSAFATARDHRRVGRRRALLAAPPLHEDYEVSVHVELTAEGAAHIRGI